MRPNPEPPTRTDPSPPVLFRHLGGSASRERWLVLALAAAAVAAVLFLVDLTPRVEGDFFFASDAPELRSAARIDALFPSRPQVLLAVGGDVRSEPYAEAIGRLTEELSAIEGVVAVRSLTSGPSTPNAAFSGPFWSRLLAPEDTGLTYLILEVTDRFPASSVTAIEGLADRAAQGSEPELSVAISGVPYVVERIRRALLRDLRVFTGAAVVVFGLVVALLYRDRWIVTGVLATCLTACATTLALLSLSGLAIGVLTANIVTIVFVLTLSHLIYLTANWHRLGALEPALKVTGEASFWCMVTTLAGFVSLLFASAEPLRELGKAGALGTVVALAAAYGLYPPFLRARPRSDGGPEPGPAATRDPFGGRPLGATVAVIACLTAIAALGLPRITTDPGLLAYFDADSPIRAGLEVVDASGGSSPLRVLFRDRDGARLDTDDTVSRLGAVQKALEADPAVGTALSLAPLVDEAAQVPLASFMGTRRLVDMLASPTFGGAAGAFVDGERELGVVFLRMREGATDDTLIEDPSREGAIARVRGAFAAQGFEVEAVAGLYQLQGELADLVASSLVTSLGGLVLLFAGVAWVVSRQGRSAGAMLACLAGTPIVLFGSLGLAGLPVDFISSPAANVALAVGIDSMIHLATAARRARGEGLAPWAAWVAARARLARPVAGAGLILAAGFGLFVLSSFPPTRRFGVGVVVGMIAATALTLVVLPWLATVGRRGTGEGPADETERDRIPM